MHEAELYFAVLQERKSTISVQEQLIMKEDKAHDQKYFLNYRF
jgi:hypothetical protein